jgi:hypothetical protein
MKVDEMTEIEIIDAEIVDAEVMGYETIEELIVKADDTAMRAFNVCLELRWKSGRKMLAERQANGGKQLPHGRLDEIVALTGCERSELHRRMQFAEQYPTEEKVLTAVNTFSSWTEVRKSLTVKPKPEVVDTAGNEQPAPAQEPAPVDEPVQDTPKREVTQSNQPDTTPKDYKPWVHEAIQKIILELHALYDRDDWTQYEYDDLYTWFEAVEQAGSDLKGFVYKNKFDDAQREYRDSRKSSNK